MTAFSSGSTSKSLVPVQPHILMMRDHNAACRSMTGVPGSTNRAENNKEALHVLGGDIQALKGARLSLGAY